MEDLSGMLLMLFLAKRNEVEVTETKLKCQSQKFYLN